MSNLCQLGVPTILVNNAAIVHGKQLVDLSPERVERYVSRSCVAMANS